MTSEQANSLHLRYGELWNDNFHAVTGGYDESEARSTYEAGEDIGVIAAEEPVLVWENEEDDDFELTRGEVPAVWVMYLSRAAGNVSVKFYNFWGTREAEYLFVDHDGRLFLTEISQYEFEDMTQWQSEWAWSRVTTHHFEPDGSSYTDVTTLDEDENQDVQRTEYAGGDFGATHWEEWPAFGDWSGLTRRPRAAAPDASS